MTSIANDSSSLRDLEIETQGFIVENKTTGWLSGEYGELSTKQKASSFMMSTQPDPLLLSCFHHQNISLNCAWGRWQAAPSVWY